MSWPLPPAAVSMPPASSGLKPTFFMRGMVSVPMVAVLATPLPEMVPMKALATTETLAGPPLVCPTRDMASFMRYSPAPVLSKMAPKSTKANTKVEDTHSGIPKMPLRSGRGGRRCGETSSRDGRGPRHVGAEKAVTG